MRTPVYRITISSAKCASVTRREIGELCQAIGAGIDGTITPCTGFGAWGVEQGFQIETAAADESAVRWLVKCLLEELGGTCAYVTVNGDPWEWKLDLGTRAGCLECTPIEGHADSDYARENTARLETHEEAAERHEKDCRGALYYLLGRSPTAGEVLDYAEAHTSGYAPRRVK
jgi:hypothetical protein